MRVFLRQPISEQEFKDDDIEIASDRLLMRRRRPATTECAGKRPAKPSLPPRPRTALERPSVGAPTRLQILNTLMGTF